MLFIKEMFETKNPMILSYIGDDYCTPEALALWKSRELEYREAKVRALVDGFVERIYEEGRVTIEYGMLYYSEIVHELKGLFDGRNPGWDGEPSPVSWKGFDGGIEFILKETA